MTAELRAKGRGCLECDFLVDEPRELERHVPGLNILSSAFGSVRAETALCRRHDVFIVPQQACAGFQPRVKGSARAACDRRA